MALPEAIMKLKNSSRKRACSVLSALLFGRCPNYRQGTGDLCSARNLAFADAVPYGE